MILKSLQPGNKAAPSRLSSNTFMVTELVPSARIQCITDRHRHYHLLPRKSIGSGEIEAKQAKDRLPFSVSVPSRPSHAPPLTATIRRSRTQDANIQSLATPRAGRLASQRNARIPLPSGKPKMPHDGVIHATRPNPSQSFQTAIKGRLPP